METNSLDLTMVQRDSLCISIVVESIELLLATVKNMVENAVEIV
ncbi:MAG: hypothetical protein ACLP5H_32800 [Desulfomonilaceae bacterium]